MNRSLCIFSSRCFSSTLRLVLSSTSAACSGSAWLSPHPDVSPSFVGFSDVDGPARRVKGLLNREEGRSAMESSDSERSSPQGPVFENDGCDGRINGESERRREPEAVGREKSESSIV